MAQTPSTMLPMGTPLPPLRLADAVTGRTVDALRLAYRGQFDDSRPSKHTPVTGASLSAAIEAVAAGRPPAGEQKPSVGCNIKWKPGNAPPSFG
ncbi:MAG TPA: hypothetical protein VLS93_18765 [Anaeromyxobacteraceae bacterium]|nr:hypothetical protein [Anaeromyxobacteraceae bacterium]